jgi:hypothetical protein
VTIAVIVLASLVLLYAIGTTTQRSKLRALHTPAVGTRPARMAADGYHPAEPITYCADCASPFPCPTLRIYGIKK